MPNDSRIQSAMRSSHQSFRTFTLPLFFDRHIVGFRVPCFLEMKRQRLKCIVLIVPDLKPCFPASASQTAAKKVVATVIS